MMVDGVRVQSFGVGKTSMWIYVLYANWKDVGMLCRNNSIFLYH